MSAPAIATQAEGLVLVVDDDVGLQDTICDILQGKGFDASGVGSATEAKEWCDQRTPDLVLLDQRLPDASGLQLAALLKAKAPALPVVLLTGYVSADTAIAAVGLVDDYLTKPVPPNELVKVVQTRLEQHRLRMANQDLLQQLREANNRLEATVQERTRELRLARDQAMEASRLKSQFLANMSHEIRTPMNGVLGAASLLATTDLTEDQRKYADILTSSGQALLAVINDVLDFSKIEAGRLDLERSTFALRESFSEAVGMFGPQAAQKSLELVFDATSDIPAAVVGDASRLRQIVTNLVGNAVKFTDSGGVRVRLSVAERGPGSVKLLCEVADSGIGVAAEDIPRLFSDFTQVDPSATRRFGGTGLGLAICDRLVKMMDGEIGCRPNSPRGSVFWFTVTLEAPPSPAETTAGLLGPADNAALPPHEGDTPNSPVILVVEDNEVNAMILTRMLELLGYRSDVARSGADALQAVKDTQYAAILMDCQMPVMDGFTTTRRLRADPPDGPRVPIIAVTATATTEDQERCLAAGMDDYLPKPIIMERLASVLERCAPITR